MAIKDKTMEFGRLYIISWAVLASAFMFSFMIDINLFGAAKKIENLYFVLHAPIGSLTIFIVWLGDWGIVSTTFLIGFLNVMLIEFPMRITNSLRFGASILMSLCLVAWGKLIVSALISPIIGLQAAVNS
jgi:hypothetical protein